MLNVFKDNRSRMSTIKKSALVNHSAEKIYDLVNSVDQYPDFLPWCGGASIDEQSKLHMVAEITIGYRGINKAFKTSNELLRPTETLPGGIKMNLLEGPFKQLDGKWTFTPLDPQGSRIEFELSYQFSSVLVAKLIGPVFDRIAETFVDSFVRRAEELHGR